MKPYVSLFLTTIAIFAMLLVGAYFSPTFEQQMGYLELFFLLGTLLFIFSLLVIFSAIGFKSFAIFLALFTSIVLVVFGIEGALLMTGMTYFLWGMVFAIQVLLFDNGVESAKEWFESRYTFKTFKQEYHAFYPMMLLFYVLLERIPYLLYRESLLRFEPQKVLQKMETLLKSE